MNEFLNVFQRKSPLKLFLYEYEYVHSVKHCFCWRSNEFYLTWIIECVTLLELLLGQAPPDSRQAENLTWIIECVTLVKLLLGQLFQTSRQAENKREAEERRRTFILNTRRDRGNQRNHGNCPRLMFVSATSPLVLYIF